jgi:hypothetical protein
MHTHMHMHSLSGNFTYKLIWVSGTRGRVFGSAPIPELLRIVSDHTSNKERPIKLYVEPSDMNTNQGGGSKLYIHSVNSYTCKHLARSSSWPVILLPGSCWSKLGWSSSTF